MKKLSEKEIIRLMREEWVKKVNGLLSEKSEKSSDNLKMLARVNGKETHNLFSKRMKYLAHLL